MFGCGFGVLVGGLFVCKPVTDNQQGCWFHLLAVSCYLQVLVLNCSEDHVDVFWVFR